MDNSFEIFQLGVSHNHEQIHALLYGDENDSKNMCNDVINWDLMELEQRDSIEISRSNISLNNDPRSMICNIVSAKLEDALNKLNKVTSDRDRCNTVMSTMQLEIKNMKIQMMQLEIELRHKDIEIYNFKMTELIKSTF